MNDFLTNMTKRTGNVLEKIRRNNKLIESQRKQYNPTFVEIMEELQKDDKTLYAMLMFWYMQKHSMNDKEFNKIIEQIEKEMRNSYIIPTADYIGGSCGTIVSGSCGWEDDSSC